MAKRKYMRSTHTHTRRTEVTSGDALALALTTEDWKTLRKNRIECCAATARGKRTQISYARTHTLARVH